MQYDTVPKYIDKDPANFHLFQRATTKLGHNACGIHIFLVRHNTTISRLFLLVFKNLEIWPVDKIMPRRQCPRTVAGFMYNTYNVMWG